MPSIKPSIKPPRWSKPVTRRHKRIRLYAIAVAVIVSIFYFFSKPTDMLAMDFATHEAYMNGDSLAKKYMSTASFDWRTARINNTIASYTPLPAGWPVKMGEVQYIHRRPESTSARWTREKRRVAVREAFVRGWKSYKKAAWMRDELRPITNVGHDTFGGWAATLVDALDTLWIMGLKEEFEDALEAVAAIDFGKSEMLNISVFETTIRYLGGLLSAYDLSGRKILLDKAIQLGEMLYRAFDTPNHMPLDRLPIEQAKTGEGFTADGSICIAGVASLTMEFIRLAQIAKQPKYYDAVARVTDLLDRSQNTTRLPGMFPIWMNAYMQDFGFDSSFTLGAMADSAYEYFPKTFALLGGLEPVYQKLYDESMAQVDKHMLFRPMLPEEDDVLISGNVIAGGPDSVHLDAEGQHLTCFVGGMFALAGRIFKNDHHVDLGAKLTEGCIYAYKSMPTGIMPEIFDVVPCKSRTHCPWNQTAYEEDILRRTAPRFADNGKMAIRELKLPTGFTSIRDKRYLLRPEAIESVFIMHRITGEQHYADAAWDMFTSIQKATVTAFANAALEDVTTDSESPLQSDSMESFWLAETLKYFYLVFSEPDMIDLDDWVLNTEAHPFRRPK